MILRFAVEFIKEDFFGFLRYCLLLFFGWIVEPTPKKDENIHKILVIGDQLALGYGDTFYKTGRSGISNYLWSLITESPKVRKRWFMFNCGVFGATSYDWIPGSKTDLFKKTFENPKYADCDIVIIFLGLQDIINGYKHQQNFTFDKTYENLVILIESLEKMGKAVGVCYVPNPESWNLKKVGKLNESYERQLNAKLEEYIDRKKDKSIVLGPMCDLSNYYYFRSNLYDSKYPIFNNNGYELLSKEWFPLVLPLIAKCELRSLFGKDYI